jgi:hypothetical protein
VYLALMRHEIAVENVGLVEMIPVAGYDLIIGILRFDLQFTALTTPPS